MRKCLKEMDLPQRHGAHREEKLEKEKSVTPISRVFAYEWQAKDLRDRECVRVAGKGVTGTCFAFLAHERTQAVLAEIAGWAGWSVPGRAGWRVAVRKRCSE